MASLDDLTTQQDQTGSEIERLISNYKRDSASRKTEEYCVKRIKEIGDLWNTFRSMDDEIQEKYGGETHRYFQNEYFSKIEKLYDFFQEDIKKYHSQPKTQFAASSLEKQLADAKLPINNDPSLATALRRLRGAISSLRCALDDVRGVDSQQTTVFYDVKCRSIERLWANIEVLHDTIWGISDDPVAAGFDEKNYLALSKEVESAIISLQEKSMLPSVNVNSSSTNVAAPKIKLPNISLPKFDGNYLSWKQFHDLFIQIVHGQNLGNAQKMWYLKTSLTGEAERCISHLTISDANYLSAWNMLKERYDNDRLLVSALLGKLVNQPAATSESPSSIRALHDVTKDCLLSLQNLKVKTENWDPLLLHILTRKIDGATHTLYEQGLDKPKTLQSLKEFLTFLEKRFQTLETLGTKGNKGPNSSQNFGKRTTPRALAVAAPTISCFMCKGDHLLSSCSTFLKMTPEKRLQSIQRAGRCVNCLKGGHRASHCPSGTCKKCSKKHNTLLHLEVISTRTTQGKQTLQADDNDTTRETSASLSSDATARNGSYTLLSTILVRVSDKWSNQIQARAILDSGSQLNFISEKLLKKLQLPTSKHFVQVGGIGLVKQDTQTRANIKIHSIVTGFSTNLEVHALPKIISPQPAQRVETASWPIPQNIPLADPQFYRPGPIDILIGAELFFSILSVGQIKLGPELPILQNTAFGWTVAGRTTANRTPANPVNVHCGICSEDESLDAHIQRFWQLEETETPTNNYTAAENRCEEFFVQTTKRDNSGRFAVRLPFKQDPQVLGESCDNALRRFYSLERKLARDPALKQKYIDFMTEYINLGHMSEICYTMVDDPHYFLPHHCVLKPESTTTKLRVVFDASAKTTTNLSLNDVLATGPTIQGDVFTILLRFRLPRYVFTADIEKMYRQVQVDPADRKFQLIWWRNSPDDPLRCFQLNTITYGTASASYLATRTLHMLADTVQAQYPLASHSLKNDFYVDDILAGSNHLATCLQRQSELIASLKTAGIKLRKWCTNHPQLLKGIPPEDQAIELDFSNQSSDSIKTMGLKWQPKTDTFAIQSSITPSQKVTKRTASSDIAHIFDPLGILAPVVITAKLFLQKLWELKLDWDAAIPQDLHTTWLKFRESLDCLNHITFPRHVLSHKITARIQLHVFADASERAYGAAAYIRAIDRDNITTVRLLCAKSKVAPVKQITLPRLELCAAKLATQLKQRIKNDLHLENSQTFLWTDSTVVLGWIKAESSNFHTFVANRISAIQRSSIPEQWGHVKSADNPADLLSRGIQPEKLASNSLWFYGPTFLHRGEDAWPKLSSEPEACMLEKRVKPRAICTSAFETDDFILNIHHRNSFRRLQRILGYVIRFVNAARGRPMETSPRSLSVNELGEAQNVIIRHVQRQSFSCDIDHIAKYGEGAKNSQISSLTPFLDQSGVLRVGGRLESSILNYQAKHPALLPNSHPITKMIINELHHENMHAGPQALLAITRQQFWPIGGKNLARSVVQHCVRCTRAKPRLLSQLMGNLPADRVQPARPFVNSGVDFCGPVFVHFKIRGKQPQKAYVAVFCCFATKAVHLELVSDLSTEGFLGALRRFTSRRGHCRNLYCDNATNFVGARNQLQELHKVFSQDVSQDKIRDECNSKGIDFHFIPPRAPHFGGLWEAAVKCAKKLMQHSLAAASLTYEEMETVVVGVEAILNSRPITPLSNDANDYSALTPAHFLIGEPLTACIDPQAQPRQASLLTRWKLVEYVKNEFWKRWSSEYLNELQHRYKWKRPAQNVRLGTMVIMKEDNVPPLKWPLGRITNVIKGEDGLVRVVDVRTASNTLRRPIHRLAPLPTEEDTEVAESVLEPASSSVSKTASQPGKERAPPRSPSQQEHIPKKRARSSILSLLLVCLFLSPTGGSPVTVHPLTTNPGLYFENLGRANIIASEWHVITYYDMQPFWKQFDLLRTCSSALVDLSLTMSHPMPYEKVALQISRTMEDIEQNNQLLRYPRSSRTRRGALNFVGNAANFLFGVLDSKYAEDMSTTIDSLKTNEGHLARLLHNQTSILDATINVMKKDHQAIEQEFKRIEDQLTKLDSMRNAFQEEAKSLLFTLLSMQIVLIATNFQRSQGLILDALMKTRQGHVSSQLISPDQIKDVLTTIRANLPPSLRLPIPQDDIFHVYGLSTLEGRMTEKRAIFKLRIPLISSDDFELFRVIPVPVKMNDSFAAIRPSFPFLMVNLHRDRYYPLTEAQLGACIAVDRRHLCSQHLPLYKIGSSVAACEINLLNQLHPHPVCQMMNLESRSSWTQLHAANQWLFSLKEETTINAVCGETMSQLIIRDAGILTVGSNCVIKQPLITIYGHKVYNTTNDASFIPPFNLTDLVTTSNLSTALRYHHHFAPHVHELESIKQQLAHMDVQVPELMEGHTTHHYTIGYGTLFLVIASLIGLFWAASRIRRLSQSSPATAVTTTVHHDAETPREPFTVDRS